jgi:Prenyltransferase and squalene oxidase repeat
MLNSEKTRVRAIQRGLEFIYRVAGDPSHFANYGSDLLYFFCFVASTSLDRDLRRAARRMAKERFAQWRRDHRALPRDADADTVADFLHGATAVGRLGIRDLVLRRRIKTAAKRYSAADYLWFDPLSEAPPDDVPEACYCGVWNERGRQVCRIRRCRQPLTMMSRYQVWYYSLSSAYCGERYGVRLGARYDDVFKWLPTLWPYRGREGDTNPDFPDAVYAVTHIVYTLNDYGAYRLSPRLLPREFEFLKASLKEAVALDDPDMVGECLDSLRAFGLEGTHPLIRAGVRYLLSCQNPDGSWGDTEAEDIYHRYHPTWAAVDGLREYAWKGEGLRFPRLRPLLERWAEGRP